MEKRNSKPNASTTGVVIPQHISGDLRKFWDKKLKLKLTLFSQIKVKIKKIIMQNLSWRIFFQEQVNFVKLDIWFQFYNPSNKDKFFTHLVF